MSTGTITAYETTGASTTAVQVDQNTSAVLPVADTGGAILAGVNDIFGNKWSSFTASALIKINQDLTLAEINSILGDIA